MTRPALVQVLASIGGCKLLEPISRGPVSAVFKARRIDTGVAVAVKLIRPERNDGADRLRRFEQDSRASMWLRHDNLIKTFDVGPWGEGLYIVMDLIEGPSLAEHLAKRGRLKEAEAVPLIAQVASVLHNAHQNHLLHRNVKPENILLAPDGTARLGDFGLFKRTTSDIDLNRPASAGGALPHCMAPELLHDPDHSDPLCDIYALGATLYTALTGEVPFRATTLAGVLKKKLDGDLAPVWALLPSVSEGIDRAIMRALSPNPALRQATCAEFLTELTGKTTTRAFNLRRTRAAPVSSEKTRYAGRERRSRKRHPSNAEAQCIPFASYEEDRWMAQITDVSMSGVGLSVNRNFEVGTKLLLFPRNKGTGQGPLVVRVVRQKSQVGRKWQLGCAFIHRISEEEMKALIAESSITPSA